MTDRTFTPNQFDDAPQDISLADNPVEPRDAATMILVRNDGPKPRILMGQRASGHDFMPNKYVFPGGRMEPSDLQIQSTSSINSNCNASLRLKSKTPPEGLLLSAIRETFEETGLLIGQNTDQPIDAHTIEDKSWHTYFAHNVRPCFQNIKFIGRAITPPYRPKRFDARFFIADSEKVLANLKRPIDSHELIDLRWFTFDEIAELDLPRITRFTITEAQQRIEKPDITHQPFFTYWKDNERILERLSA